MTTWNMSHRDALMSAAHWDIPPDDADTMWAKYVELGDAVRSGATTDKDALEEFGLFCQGLVLRRISL